MELNDKERQPCEVWTRCMGYHRPVSEYNKGKKAEYYERVCFTEKKALEHNFSTKSAQNPQSAA